MIAFLVSAALHLVWQTRRRTRRPTKELMISPLSGLAMGAMLMGLQAIVQPEARHAVVEIQKEEAVDDESGLEPAGGRAFHEQLRRIRHGGEVDAVTVRMAESAASDGEL
ncbi:MAG TPA: hypothetical protein VHX60_06855 [Acidobacteriaceae bacterium]|nr:hypothetical protein [Acidobacteriaceae bacterium]